MNKTAISATLLLCACTTPQTPHPVRQEPLHCPPVAECRLSDYTLHTNQDLAHAYIDTHNRLQQCKIARDTLAQCIAKQGGRLK